ncbi:MULTISPECIES: acyl carrier protein [unclassified Streptomyces]|uniref:acyl carrier protein n=1 Tax=unclassified Streptomyces TaxID=2593676 RepID=UPI00342C50FD
MADSAGNKEAIREFILDNISESTVGDDEDIFERGLVRSMFVMQLVLFVEQEFGVSITGEDLQFDNFRTIDRIDELVSRKLATV